jgi:replicative DNA helicase
MVASMSEFHERVPANLDAERLVLGAIQPRDELYAGFVGVLRPEYFFLEKHHRIFGRMKVHCSEAR